MPDSRLTDISSFRQGLRDGGVSNYDISAPIDLHAATIADLMEVIDCSFSDVFNIGVGTFNKPVLFKNYVFKGKVSFDKVVFSSSIHFRDCVFEEELCFSSISFEQLEFFSGKYDKVQFTGNINTGKDFPAEISFSDGDLESLHFNGKDVNAALSFKSGNFKYIYLSNSNFQGSFSVDSASIKIDHISIDSCSFQERVDFKRSAKVGALWFHRVLLNQMTIFHSGFICDDLSLNSVTAKQRVGLVSNGNVRGVRIGDCDFLSSFECDSYGGADRSMDHSFSCDLHGVIRGNILFENIVVSSISLSCNNFGNIVFRNTDTHLITIKDFLNYNRLTFANLRLVYQRHILVIFDSNMDKTEFVNVDFRKFEEIVIARSEVSNLILSNSVLPPDIRIGTSDPKFGYVIAADEKINDDTYYRENYRQLKLAMEKQGNRSASLLYKAREMHYLRREMDWGWDKVLLYLNYVSNNHGLSWSRGVLFTLFSSALMYFLFVLSMPLSSVGLAGSAINYAGSAALDLKGFAEFLASFPLYKRQSDIAQDWLPFIVIMLSRIVVGYGIYQTVAAFRKFAGK